MPSRDLIIACLLSGWGFAAMMSTLWKIRGLAPKFIFWVSMISFVTLLAAIWAVGEFYINALNVTELYLPSVFLFFGLIGFGMIVCPLIMLIFRSQNPTIFKKQPSNLASSPSQTPMKVETESLGHQASPTSHLGPNPAATSLPAKSAYIFVSYRRSDSADATGRIYDRLVTKFGKSAIFKDVDSIPLGLDFKDYLGQKVSECHVLLAVIGDRWLGATDSAGKRRLDDPNDFVRIEIQSALERNIPVIPLLTRDAQMPQEESLPPSLRKLIYRNGIPIRSDPDFHRDMDRLIAALEEYVRQEK